MKEYKLKINSNDYHVVVSGLSNGRADVMVNGQSYSVEIADAGAASDAGKSASAPAVTATAPAPAAKPAAGGAVKSPLPGVVLDIQVAVGDRVGTGQRLMILRHRSASLCNRLSLSYGRYKNLCNRLSAERSILSD